MKSYFFSIMLLLTLSKCADEMPNLDEKPNLCATKATVRDLNGLDGCGFVFELADGTKLEPLIVGFCGTPALLGEITEDALFDFEFIEGREVFISYELVKFASICMVGPTVKITCITEISFLEEESSL